MVYLLPGLRYPPHENDQFTSKDQIIGLACTAYICASMFAILLVFALYNTWKYLIK